MKWMSTRTLAVVITVAMIGLSSGRANAMLAPAAQSAMRSQDLLTVQTFLEQKEVGHQLAGYGLSQQEVQSRLGNLSDQEIHQVATRIQNQNPGRDGGGFIVTILLIGILALLFVYLLKRV